MTEKNRGTWGKILAGTAALVMALSMAGCANSSDDDDDKEDKAETTTTTTVAETEAPEEEETEAETEAVTEEAASDADSSAVVTTVPDDLDAQIDSMIASAEALISEMDAAFGTNSTGGSGSSTSSTATDTGSEAVTTTTTTAAPAAPAVGDASLTSAQQFVFDGVTYDNTTFTSAGITKPSGWSLNPEASSGKEYINSAYPGCGVVEGQSKGASFMIHQAKQDGKTSLPPLTLYKGLTWGASVSDIKAAFGTPAKESHQEHYGTSLTNLFYSAPDGALIVYEVSDEWGLIVIDCFGK